MYEIFVKKKISIRYKRLKIGNSSRFELIGIEANKPGRYLADKVADDIVIIFKDIVLEKFWNYQVKQFHEILLRRVKFKIEAHRISGLLLLLWTGYLHIFSTDSTFFFFFLRSKFSLFLLFYVCQYSIEIHNNMFCFP